ncbi:MAG TPA: hypothetical protein VFP05_01205, partial [Thermomicrobiales bacterium]|nr:hypothetical protein [Thermomicrobiales bacterium]
MKVTKVETIWLDEFSNVIWIQIHTDEGPIGLGETFLALARSRRTSTKPSPRICWARIHSRSTG